MPRSDTQRRATLLLLGLAAVTILLGIAVPLAPVQAAQPVVQWPRAGEQPTSTVLPLVPYRPLSLDATVPCDALRTDGTALRTLPPDAGRADLGDQGLTVTAADGGVTVTVSGTEVLTESVPASDCTYRVTADETGVRVDRDGTPLAQEAVLPPQVAQLVTETRGPATEGLTVTLRTDDRYASTPSPLKVALLVAHVLGLLATLTLGMRLWRGTGPGLRRPRLGLADGVLLAVTLAWAVLGPMNYDDAWYASMARNAGEAGYLGNYIYMFNVSENPFVSSQYALQAWGGLGGWSLLWLRVLPVLYGLGTWVLLRVLLETVLGRAGRLRAVPWALLVAHLVWWLPYGMTLRPEPVIVLCSAGVLVLAELARRRGSVGVLGLAVAVAALAVTASPSGLVAAAPLVLALPWLSRLLAERGWLHRITAVALAAAAATILIPVGFADASLGDVLDATAVHSWYYFTYPWYAEYIHYGVVLVGDETGSWGRRAPVVLTLVLLLVVAIGSGRRPQGDDPARRLLLTSAVSTAVALVLLMPTPTKWVNHFGAVTALATVLLATALLRSPLPRRAGAVVSTGTVLLLVGGGAVIFAGPNIWRPYSDWGQPFGDHTVLDGGSPFEVAQLAPNIGPLFLRNPLLWGLLAVGVAVALFLYRRGGGRTTLSTDRVLLWTSSGGIVALMLLVFVLAPVRQHPGWSVASGNAAALRGDRCGLAEAVQVLRPAGVPLRAPVGDVERTGSFAAGATAPFPVAAPLRHLGSGAAWHSEGGAPAETGTLRTPWYPVPADAPDDLVVAVAGGQLAAHQVRLEIATGPDLAADVEIALGLDDRLAPNSWQEVDAPLDELAGGERATAVRVVAQDAVSGPGSWLAVAEPVLAQWQPAASVSHDRPAFADQLSMPLWPCADQVAIAHGIAGAPSVRLLADSGIWRPILVNPTFLDWGGVFVGADRTSTTTELVTRLDPLGGAPMLPWGQVQTVVYDHPVGLVDLRVDVTRRAGWERGPTLAGEDYAGREYLG